MHFEIAYNPAHSLATAYLGPHESFRAEAQAMVSMSGTVRTETTATSKGQGGFLRGLKRVAFGGESFFQNRFSTDGNPGQVCLAPALTGSMVVHELGIGRDLLIQGSSYVASAETVELDTQFQGLKSLFSGESFFFLKASGQGPVLMNAFGAIEERELSGELVVDTGHLVAFESGIEYTIGKAASGWIQSFLSGEGFVLRMRGHGKVWLQSRNPKEFGSTVGKLLPPREG